MTSPISRQSRQRAMRVVLGLAGAFGGAVAAVTGTAVGYGYMLGSAPKPCPHCDGEKRRGDARGTVSANSGSCVDEALRRRAYDGLADSFDDEIEWHELMTGIKLMRWWLMRQARGDVLEVAAGTGRNFSYYPEGIRLTAADCSEPMMEVCRAKVAKSLPSGATPPATVVADAAKTPFRDESFDTVVDTFGLCSFEDPVAALREMGRVCRRRSPSRRSVGGGGDDAWGGEGDGGRIFLLEHGRSQTHGWLSNILDHFATPHAERWGCYWNRDIVGAVREAGLEIQECRTFHLGTTYYIVATPPPR